MAYEFKKLSDVAAVETPADTANVLIEEDGVIKKAPKSAVGGAGSSGDVQSDWNQNDPTAPDYIKNRPFSENFGKVVIISETVGTVVAGNTIISYNSSLLDWVIGNTVYIKWDGVEYEAVCKENSDGSLGYSFKVDGEHSVEFQNNNAIFNLGGSYFVVGDTHTYEVSAYRETVIQLDEKFIPDTIARNEENYEKVFIIGLAEDDYGGGVYPYNCTFDDIEKLHASGKLSVVNYYGEWFYLSRRPSYHTSIYSRIIVGDVDSGVFNVQSYEIDTNNNTIRGVFDASPLRVYSSTPGSSKQFKITVDDNGTITAKEITE